MKTLPTWVACALMAGLASVAPADDNWSATEISTAAVRALAAPGVTYPVILDVRTPEEYAAGHVPGAINIPHDQVRARLAEIDSAKDQPIVVYCRSGRRAAQALATLHDAGFSRLLHMTGDMLAWDQEAGTK